MTRAVAALGALAAAGALAGPVPAAQAFFLNSAYDAVAYPPPLPPGSLAQQTPAEFRNPGRVNSRERIDVGVGPAGSPVAVSVLQELRVRGTGDYAFVVPAPATSVEPGPGSESLPGLRNVGILWQGFSDRHRFLSARAVLRPRPAAKGLPLRVTIERRGTRTVVRFENVARRRLRASVGPAKRSRLVAVLAGLRRSYARSGFASGPLDVGNAAGRTVELGVAAPLRLTGEIRSRGGARRDVDVLLGDGRPLSRAFVLGGPGAPTVDVHVTLLSPLAILPTRAALAHGPDPVRAFQTALGAAATSWAYRQYLVAPGSDGVREASYHYRSVTPRRAPRAAVREVHDDTLTVLLAIALGLLGLVGLAMVWARS